VFAGLLFVPVFDTFRVFTVRISCGFSPFYPDKRHIHHKFLELGFTHASATLAIMATQLIFFIMNVLLQQLNVNAILAIDITLGLIYIYMLDNICSKRKLN
jgi:UDP-N-acetylmuramyl pentapeptide phosphotransferase/UDP-N-acetylglucosamine-1-phosphate transferase